MAFIKVLINNTEVMAELADKDYEYSIKSASRLELFREIITAMIEDLAESKFSDKDKLTEGEIDDILSKILYNANDDDLIMHIVDNRLKDLVEEAYQWAIDNRVKYFEVRMNYSGTFHVMVKAKSEDEAIDYIEDGNVDLSDYIDPDEADIGTDGVAHKYDDEPCWVTEIIEAE